MLAARVLPYLQLQAFYVLFSGLLSFAAWELLAGLRPRLRAAASAALVAGLCGAALVLFPRFLDLRDARGFGAIATAFYALAFWLPAFALPRAVAADRRFAAALLLPPAVALWALFVEPNRTRVRHERVEVAGWDAGAPPFLVVHVSDLQTVGACRREREAVRAINALEPDLIVVSGDYMAGPFWDPEPGVAAARAFLGALRARHGVVVVAGHAEPERFRERIFADLGLAFLANEGRAIELEPCGRRLAVYGLDVEEPDPAGLAALRAEPAPGGTATLVVSHVPDVTYKLDGLGVDLHLAGHTHGGQVVVPLLGPPLTLSDLPRRLARGLHPVGDHLLNVCAGLGMEGNHAPRIRLFCPPEVCAIELVGAGR